MHPGKCLNQQQTHQSSILSTHSWTKHCWAKSYHRQLTSQTESSQHAMIPGWFKVPYLSAYPAYQYLEFQSEDVFDFSSTCPFNHVSCYKTRLVPVMSITDLHDGTSTVYFCSPFLMTSETFDKTGHSFLQ